MKDLRLPLLITLFHHGGSVKKLIPDDIIIKELQKTFELSDVQKLAVLETWYAKESRPIRINLWTRLLYRAASQLDKEGLLSKPTDTKRLTGKREWLLTEQGFAEAVNHLSSDDTSALPITSVEVEQEVKLLSAQSPDAGYSPINTAAQSYQLSARSVRGRAFRLGVLRAYDQSCAVCGLRIQSPSGKGFEAEAAHIVAHERGGKADIVNGLSLCRMHHWGFDAGWFSLSNDCRVQVSSKIRLATPEPYRIANDYFQSTLEVGKPITIPTQGTLRPHPLALEWHRANVFYP